MRKTLQTSWVTDPLGKCLICPASKSLKWDHICPHLGDLARQKLLTWAGFKVLDPPALPDVSHATSPTPDFLRTGKGRQKNNKNTTTKNGVRLVGSTRPEDNDYLVS